MNALVDGMLDVSALPTEQSYSGAERTLDLRKEALTLLKPLVDGGIAQKRYQRTDSFGFALAAPSLPGTIMIPWADWDDPNELVWLVGGWGPQKNRVIANAARKLRACARLGEDTLPVAMRADVHDPFLDAITDDEWELEGELITADPNHRLFRYGDFGYGGAASVTVCDVILMGGVSGVTQQEDHIVVRHLLDELALMIWKADNASE